MRIKARGSPLKISKLSCQTTKIGSKQRRSTIWNHASLRYTINETSEVRFAIYAFDYALRINLQHASASSPCAANDNVNDHRAATSDSPFRNARTSPLRVHRIVIPRFSVQYAFHSNASRTRTTSIVSPSVFAEVGCIGYNDFHQSRRA